MREGSMHCVLPGLYRIPLGLVNAYLIEDESGVTLIDCGDVADAPRVLQALTTRGHRITDVKCVLTHLHYDHAGSAAQLQQYGMGAALMHPLDGMDAAHGVLMRRPFALSWPLSLWQHTIDTRPLTTGNAINVDASAYHDQFLSPHLRVLHTPGHTAGHIALLWHRHGGVLIAGDAFLNFCGLRKSIGHEHNDRAAESRRALSRLTYAHLVVGHGNPIIGHADQRVRRAFMH
jgi:glyoxylase-like metal-dependent hydrolase (beta-lactamase superfamily II)